MLGGIGFYFFFYHLHDEEDKLTLMKASKYIGDNRPNAVGEEADAAARHNQGDKA